MKRIEATFKRYIDNLDDVHYAVNLKSIICVELSQCVNRSNELIDRKTRLLKICEIPYINIWYHRQIAMRNNVKFITRDDRTTIDIASSSYSKTLEHFQQLMFNLLIDVNAPDAIMFYDGLLADIQFDTEQNQSHITLFEGLLQKLGFAKE